MALSRWASYTRARKKRALQRWSAAVHRERTVLRAVLRRLVLLRWQRQRERHAFRIIANRHKQWLVHSKWESWRGRVPVAVSCGTDYKGCSNGIRVL